MIGCRTSRLPSQENYPDYDDAYGYGMSFTTDMRSEAVMLPAHRPLTHTEGLDEVPPGAYEFGSAHMVRAVPETAYEHPCHRAYGVMTRRRDGSYAMVMCSAGTDKAHARMWSEGRMFRQTEVDLTFPSWQAGIPDEVMPKGAYGMLVDHFQSFPVEVIYSADYLICDGID